MVHKPSKYQQAVFQEVRNGTTDLLVKAVAGAGKSWVLRNSLKLIPPTKRIIFVAFNKAISEENKQKLPSKIKNSTIHSLGMSSLRERCKGIKVSDAKMFKFISPKVEKYISKLKKEAEKIEDETQRNNALKLIPSSGAIKYKIKQLTNLYRVNLLDDVEKVKKVADNYSIKLDKDEFKLFSDTISDMNRYNLNPNQKGFQIDFTDMIYLPNYYNLDLEKFDFIMVDECQDLSVAQFELVNRLRHKTSRIVFCGDENQGIFGFAGASHESFQNIENIPNIKKLPLSICYRCGKNIIKHAQLVNPEIEHFEDNEDGEVIFDGNLEDLQDGDMVLCRNTKPLVSLYMDLIANGVKSFIKGKDIGENIIKMIEPYKNLSSSACLSALDNDLEKYEIYLKKKGIKSPKKSEQYYEMYEKMEVCKIFLDQVPRVRSAISNIQLVFQEQGEGVMLSTIHKAKGLEADNVYIIRRDLIPSKFADQDWMLEQEKNLLYVAITRPRKKLVYVSNTSFSGIAEDHRDYNKIINYSTTNLFKFWNSKKEMVDLLDN